MYRSIHPFNYVLIHHTDPSTFLFIHSFIHPFNKENMHQSIYPSIYAPILLSIHPSIHPWIHPCFRAFRRLHIHSSIHQCIYISSNNLSTSQPSKLHTRFGVRTGPVLSKEHAHCRTECHPHVAVRGQFEPFISAK